MTFRAVGFRALAGGTALLTAITGAPAQAQIFIAPPDFSGTPVTGPEPGIGLPLPGATPAELTAHLVWNLRAGLNVAALQCQFSPTLMTVRNYNQMLRNHAKELEQTRVALANYFTRTVGKGRPGQLAFDSYTTKTYQSFSTMYAQLGFCHTAALLGRDANGRAKGSLHEAAQQRLREFRNSLIPAWDRIFLTRVDPVYVDPIEHPCLDRKGRMKKKC